MRGACLELRGVRTAMRENSPRCLATEEIGAIAEAERAARVGCAYGAARGGTARPRSSLWARRLKAHFAPPDGLTKCWVRGVVSSSSRDCGSSGLHGRRPIAVSVLATVIRSTRASRMDFVRCGGEWRFCLARIVGKAPAIDQGYGVGCRVAALPSTQT